MDIRKIKNLIDLVDESTISEIEIIEGEGSIRISRNSQGAAVAQVAPVAQSAYNPMQQIVATTAAPAAPVAAEKAELPEGKVIRSPMVGTFYRAASPTSSVFTDVGQTVNVGDTVCIVEAMKMFNQIEAEISGKVVSILVQNGEPVEFDQPLFILE
ncbi:acetyl-CoA carboxylase biotin carboxyl carrier protein [Wohlfahrtiimonas chitiniclastica]|uniref:acetyl-CoA carboxylase biotin carboxyl carrier protein n=1 Tax=Wohlfahrtiimonas chitiniclastica TaxID=400946 RepID=UPI001BD116DF|nr:acetyl-CoA carboxylase biotin carboxyl carrier protein [Wohlfahrtiimonas chitiniclastica]MBS7819160.1 acetyl-CoA carboxylase biotin carboxyl carrier protein [Wohlfahrtiimonas chitiniclastica]MBS7826843.1 acetyl-CoA carboxylase biotin carboxyl carrier protein [Wohlfahrtiimonas chitiniclastica]